MKIFIYMIILFISVTSLCLWDSIYTEKVFTHMEKETETICNTTLSTSVEDENLKIKIENLNDYWTKKMDILCISISRKDLQIISDYIQYLNSAIINKNHEDAITYSRLLNYNVIGLNQSTGINFLNIL